MIPVYKPYFTKESLIYAHDAIDSTWISSHGKYLSLIKDKLKKISDCNYVILTNNGTSATHLVAKALKFKYPEIKNLVVPSNVYVAAWNMFVDNPNYNLIPVDSCINTWNPNLDNLSKIYKDHKRNTAFLAVHNIGNIIPINMIKKLFPEWVIVEDNCEGFLGEYDDGKKSGTNCLASSVSFFGNKNITSGEGGMFCTNDKEIFEYINRAKSHFVTKEKFIFDGLGYNYRMTNIQAAILLGQIELLKKIQEKKSNIFKQYKKELSSIKRIKFQEKSLGTKHSNWMFGIRIEDGIKKEIDKLKLYLYQNDIDTRPMFPPINYHKHLKKYGNNYLVSEKLYETVIILPSYPELLSGEISFICNTIKEFLK